jgi:hypothetical protein
MRPTLLLCLCACVKTISDPGTPVSTTHSAPPGSVVVADCIERLLGDDGGYSPYYLVDPKGAVTRWTPDELPGGAEIINSASTSAVYLDAMLKLWAVTPDGAVHLLDENPTRGDSRISTDGTHRMLIVEKTAEWRTLDGGVEHTFTLPGHAIHVFPSPSGEHAVAQIEEQTALIDSRGATTLLDHQLMVRAAWSPDGKEVALVTAPYANGAIAAGDRRLLWRAKLDGTAPVQLPLPERPGPGLIDRVLGVPQSATGVEGLAWTRDGLVLLSNFETECWWGGRDSPSGCFWALYRLPPEGGMPKRISSRAFQCQAMFELR